VLTASAPVHPANRQGVRSLHRVRAPWAEPTGPWSKSC